LEEQVQAPDTVLPEEYKKMSKLEFEM